jgi:hypothetical protein
MPTTRIRQLLEYHLDCKELDTVASRLSSTGGGVDEALGRARFTDPQQAGEHLTVWVAKA